MSLPEHTPDAPAVTISPSDGLRGVRTIPAIKALVGTGLIGLREAKGAVERMVAEGLTDLALGRYARMLTDADTAALAMVADAALREAGVSLRIEGMTLAEWVPFLASTHEEPKGPSDGAMSLVPVGSGL
jgi:hypothetical protein